MTATDSISIFAEGTFSEQIRELVDYLGRSRSEEERPAFVQPFVNVLSETEGQKPIEEEEPRRKKALTMVLGEVKGLGGGSEKEIEGFFNLLFSHFITLLPLEESETKEHLVSLLHTITASPDQTFIKYRILTNLFNALPRRSSLRLQVYKTLLEIASAHDELELLGLSPADVDKWVLEWNVTPEEKSEFLQLIAQSYSNCGQADTAYQYTLAYVRSFPPSSPAAQTAAIDAIATALRLPSLFDFDSLFRLDAVVSAKDHELFSLLQIFLNEGLQEYRAWADSHADAFAKYDLDRLLLERKIRLLSLTTLGFQNIGRDLPYSLIVSTIQVEPTDVERWVIDVLRAGLVSGRLSQTTQTLHITRAAARAFERPQWQLLEERLIAWKTGLASVLDVVTAAKKKNSTEAVAGAAVSTPSGIETPATVPTATAAA